MRWMRYWDVLVLCSQDRNTYAGSFMYHTKEADQQLIAIGYVLALDYKCAP